MSDSFDDNKNFQMRLEALNAAIKTPNLSYGLTLNQAEKYYEFLRGDVAKKTEA